jgi:hypothetical protein
MSRTSTSGRRSFSLASPLAPSAGGVHFETVRPKELVVKLTRVVDVFDD